MIDTSFLDQLSRFNLVINKRVTSNLIGSKRSVAAGRGMTFKDYRIYAPGDDIRSIDWKVYARTDNLYLKVKEEERNLTVHIILDASSSMDFGNGISKFDYASMMGIGFAFLSLKDNEKFQFATFADSLEVFQSKKGMAHLAAMVEHLNSIRPKGKSNLVDNLIQYKKVIGNRSMLIIISDFLVNIDEIREALYSLGNHEIKIIQVLDRVEKELKIEGDMKLKDSETKSVLRTFVSPKLRIDYEKKLDDHCAKIEDVCNKLNIDYNLVITDTPIFDIFYKVLA